LEGDLRVIPAIQQSIATVPDDDIPDVASIYVEEIDMN
jgi:hypothetical protein